MKIWFLIVLAGFLVGADPEPKLNILQIIEQLQSDDRKVQLEALDNLADTIERANWNIETKEPHAKEKKIAIVEQSQAAIPWLEKLLKSDDPATQLVAVRCLWLIKGKEKNHVPILVAGLDSTDAEGRELALELLGQLGPDAEPVVPQIAAALKDDNADVRIEAASTLGKIGPGAKSAIPQLIAALEDHGESSTKTSHGTLTVGGAASIALGEFGADVIPFVTPLLKHEDPEIRHRALWTLVNAGEAALPLLPTILGALSDEDKKVRQSAVEILGRLKLAPEKVLPILAKILIDENSSNQIWAAESISRYGREAKIILPSLIVALDSEVPRVCVHAIDTLGTIGPEARNALPKLQKLQEKDGYEFYYRLSKSDVLAHAKKAIEKIEVKEPAK